MGFPTQRPRRLRQTPWLRRLVREHRLTVDDLVWPVFVQEGTGERTPVASMAGVERYTIDVLVEEVKRAEQLGIPAVALFPVVAQDKKSADGDEATNPENLVCRALESLRDACPDLGLVADVALDPFTTHGQDGVLREGQVDNDASLAVLSEQARVQAAAGASVIAPSDMMDGRVGAIRQALDKDGRHDVLILSYAAKYASAFYGPFRDALGSKASLGAGDKRSYQMDSANGLEAFREVALDLEEGADMVMIKPGMPYLDVCSQVKARFGVPTFAYQVSGEYTMMRAAADQGHVVWDAVMTESLLAFKRAGCDGIFSYAAREVAGWLQASGA